jgi:hypothetical protein
MEELICFGNAGRPPHRKFEDHSSGITEAMTDKIQPRLRAYALREQEDAESRKDRLSPHYLGFIAPFLEHLQVVRTTRATNRPTQPGDPELTALVGQFDVRNH